MGFATTTIEVAELKESLLETLTVYIAYFETLGTATERTFYQNTVNLDDIDYLFVTWYGQNGLTFKVDVGGVNKVNTTTGGANSWEQSRIDCTAITGEQVIKIYATDGGGGAMWCKEMTLWGVQS